METKVNRKLVIVESLKVLLFYGDLLPEEINVLSDVRINYCYIS